MDRLTSLLNPSPGEFYQYVLAAVYHADGLWGEATFDLYVRSLPEGWGYLIAAGLEPLLGVLSRFQVEEAEIEALRKNPVFSHIKPSFFEHLRRLRFEGEVWAMPEGTPVFAGEPILRITAPLTLCTLLETTILQLISSSTLVASRASRMVQAAAGHPVMDFGSRRWPDPAAGILAARAAYIGGFAATTNATASLRLGIPQMGTMPDTFLAAYGDDALAIKAFRHHFPNLCHMALPDDDVSDGIRRFLPYKMDLQSVRVDHKELGKAAAAVRDALDQNGMKQTKILGSGDLDEFRIEKLVASGAPVDWYAVGKALAETLQRGGMAFRIAEMSRGAEPVPVTRDGGAPYPARKQVFRFPDRDVLGLEDESWEFERLGGKALLQPVMRDGQRLGALAPLAESRQLRAQAVATLPKVTCSLARPERWRVSVSDRLASLA